MHYFLIRRNQFQRIWTNLVQILIFPTEFKPRHLVSAWSPSRSHFQFQRITAQSTSSCNSTWTKAALFPPPRTNGGLFTSCNSYRSTEAISTRDSIHLSLHCPQRSILTPIWTNTRDLLISMVLIMPRVAVLVVKSMWTNLWTWLTTLVWATTSESLNCPSSSTSGSTTLTSV